MEKQQFLPGFESFEIESFVYDGKEYIKKVLLSEFFEERVETYQNDATCIWYKSIDEQPDKIVFYTCLSEREKYLKEYKKRQIYFNVSAFDLELYKFTFWEFEKEQFWDVIFWIFFKYKTPWQDLKDYPKQTLKGSKKGLKLST